MKKGKTLFWKLYPTYLIVSISTILIFIFTLNNSFKDFYYNDTFSRLSEKAHILKEQVEPLLESNNIEELNDVVAKSSRLSNDRITIILPSGLVIADSSKSPSKMENHLGRPEIAEALLGKEGKSNRYSPTIHKELLYLALPLQQDDQIIGALRHSISIDQVNKNISIFSAKIFLVCLIFIAALGAIITWHAKSISRPLLNMKNHAEEIASGNLNQKIKINRNDPSEIVSLSRALNLMGVQLEMNLNKVLEQKNEKEIIFSSMQDGIISVDKSGKLFQVNSAARNLFKISKSEEIKGRPIEEVFRIRQILEAITVLLNAEEFVENEIVLHDKRILLLKGTRLKSEQGDNIGAILVLHDVTRVRELEQHRKQFAANVSHELRTPLTSIQGFIETLLEGDVEDKETHNKFLNIIKSQANRLGCIIEDLLTLSQIENERQIELTPQELTPIISSAISNCDFKAKSRNTELKLHTNVPVEVNVNSSLLEQSLINLIDNAIKYSSEGSQVNIEYVADAEEVNIKIIDTGPGISPEHLGRLFERFYSVDKARSRDLGGSGLGLAIVKHMILALGGTVSVTSEVGKGSVFSITLPLFQS